MLFLWYAFVWQLGPMALLLGLEVLGLLVIVTVMAITGVLELAQAINRRIYP